MLPIFKRMERYRRRLGRVSRPRRAVARHRHAAPQGAAARDDDRGRANEIGLPFNPDQNGETQEGIGMSQVTIAKGRRQSTAYCYLDPGALAREPHDRAGRDGRVADPRRQALRRRALFRRRRAARGAGAAAKSSSAGGSINSPKLLELSGIGQAGSVCARSASRRCMSCAASARTCATIIRRG